ncbi:MAG: hypothetical protein ABI700_02975 [Chloroflexota bacterium]
MFKTNSSEEVYLFIWNYVTEHEALPDYDHIRTTLDMPKMR